MPKTWTMTTEEEAANAITHGVMALLTILGIPVVAVNGYIEGGTLFASTKSIFMMSMFGMFLTSCLYHSMPPSGIHKKVFRLLDHIFIYVAIAGSYTPMAIIVIGGWLGWSVVLFQWALVIFGALYKSLSKQAVPKVSLTFYLLMGWTAIVLLPSILRNAGFGLLITILAGGLFYSVGAVFYAMKGFKYHHMVWHILINLGAASHFIAIIFLI